MCSISLADFTRDELAQGRSPADMSRLLAKYRDAAAREVMEANRPRLMQTVNAVQKAWAEAQK